MSTVSIDRALRWWALEEPVRRAVWVSGRSINYAALNEWVGQAAAMLAQSGFRSGDRACFYAETSLEWCVAAFAVIRCGGIVAPVNSRMVSAEADYLFSQYEPTVLFTDPNGLQRLASSAILGPATGKARIIRVDVASVAGCREASLPDISVALDQDAPVAIITTSGSTARPKGVVYNHRAMIDYATYEALSNALEGRAEHHKLLTTAPLSTAGGFNLLVHSIVVGGTVFLQLRFDPGEALQAVADHRINTFRANPIFFQRLAEHSDFAAADLSSIAIATAGGSQVADALLRAWWNKGVVLRQLYGQTEAGGSITINPKRFAQTDPDRCGYGSPFVEIAIMDSVGNIVPPDEPGEIVARGPGMMMQYWNNPNATAEALVDGWLHTGDIGTVDARGLLKMLDRMKDIIKSGGLNISSAELERVIAAVPGISEAAIIAAPDPKFGETPVAIVYGENPSVAALLDACRMQLSAYKVPRYVIVSETPLPRLAMGKISKPALRLMYGNDTPLPPPVR